MLRLRSSYPFTAEWTETITVLCFLPSIISDFIMLESNTVRYKRSNTKILGEFSNILTYFKRSSYRSN